jgi:hypothetical protein
MDEALQRAVANACLGARTGDELARDLGGFLEAHGVATDDIAAILAAPRRLGVYRTLVRNGLSSIVARMLPRTRARMNAARAGRFDADFAVFVDQVGPRTHYLRDIPAELFAWVGPRWRSDPTVPPYLPDLAAHELAHFRVAAAESARSAPQATEIALDRALAFAESTHLSSYGWAVHELSEDVNATDEPARREVHLIAHRDATHTVRWLELTPLAAAVLQRLLAGEPLGGAVARACIAPGTASPSVLSDLARLLSDLGARGILVGARDPLRREAGA